MFSWIKKNVTKPVPANQEFNVIVVVEEEIFCPVTYVRVLNHLQQAPDGWSSEIYVIPREYKKVISRLKFASLVLMARCVSQEGLEIASCASSAGIPILYDIDDYLWQLPKYLDNKNEILNIDKIIEQSTVVTTPSAELARFITERIPNVMVSMISNAANLPMPQSPENDLTVVMANSDFFRLTGSKEKLFTSMRDAARTANRRIWLYYFSNDPPEHNSDDPNLQIIWCGVRAYTSYRAILGRVKPELAVIALPDDHFSKYKSVIKFAEFGAAGAAGLFSNVEPYSHYVRDGIDGWLTGNTQREWYQLFEKVFTMPAADLDAIRIQAQKRALTDFESTIIRDKFFSIFTNLPVKKVPHDGNGYSVPKPHEFTFREAYDYIVEVWRNSKSYKKA
jgi:hypothetical protein